jgi:hypothetical protein
MFQRGATCLIVVLASAGCSRWNHAPPSDNSLSANQSNKHETFVVDSGSAAVEKPLKDGETVRTALASVPATMPTTQPTLLLIRRGPDGIDHQLINCDQYFNLLDPRQNQCIRNGDHLVVNPPATQPVGLNRPSVPGIPVAE